MDIGSLIKCLILIACLTAGTQADDSKLIGYTFSRVIVKLDLDQIYPDSKAPIDVDLVQSNSTSSGLDYYLINENRTLYFLSSFNHPTDLTVNMALKDDEEDIKHRSRNLQISIEVQNDYEVKSIFELSFHDTTLAELIDAEEAIKQHFRMHLWTLEGRYWSQRATVLNAFRSRSFNDKLDIKYIKPISKSGSDRDVTSFTVGIGSWYPLSDVLQSMFVLKRENDCSTVEDHKLIKFKSLTGLNFDLCSIRSYSQNLSNFKESCIINAEYKIVADGFGIKKVLCAIASVLIFVGVIIVIV